MKIKSYQEFFSKSVELVLNDPFKSRLVLRYYNTKSLCKIKITDDKTSLIFFFRTEESFKDLE